jgi:hypothetical protein
MRSVALSALLVLGTFIHAADSPPRLAIQHGPGASLQWQAAVPAVVGAQSQYKVLVSSDLEHWTPSSEVVTVDDSAAVQLPLNSLGGNQFFRLERSVLFSAPPDSGAELTGFNPTYKAAFATLGELSLDQFAALYPAPTNYLEQIDFDPTTADFWSEWNTDPAVYNANPPSPDAEQRSWDFRLNAAELATFKKLGFVVSERLSTQSFGEMLYRIYTDDLPVFLSTDSMLQAWHRSYVSMMQELEETYFYNEWISVLEKMSDAIPALWSQHGNSTLREPLLDSDFFLTVALSLAKGTNVPSRLSQDGRVSQTLEAIRAEQLAEFELFGTCRRLDFSQFKVRGHYEESIQLSHYFQMVMWLGRIEFRVTPAKADLACNANDPARELASSALLYFLLKDSGSFDSWSQMNAAIEVFVGKADSMNFAQLGALLQVAAISSPTDLVDAANITRINDLLLSGNFGVQEIMSDTYLAPRGKLPRSFTVFGQRFVPDSWALGKVVWDNFISADNNRKRFLPISLDVAFGALGNNATVPQLIAHMQTTDGFALRDGFEYQRNLAAVRQTIDSQAPEFWNQNIYAHWLGTLRTLSEPTTGANFPQALRTRAWSMKNLNTQLASWTHLRHDTVLYAKQSYSGMILCSYPKAYVEPVPKFWSALKNMASGSADFLAGLQLTPRSGSYVRQRDAGGASTWTVHFDSQTIQSNQVAFLRNFAARMASLEDISVRQLAHEPLTAEQIESLQNIVEVQKDYFGRRFTGWYPNLFYMNCFFEGMRANYDFHYRQGCDRADQIITDVHTAPSPDPGYVLHQGVGRVNFLQIAIDCGEENPVIYGGPVLSHYELPTAGLNRMTDTEWSAKFNGGPRPVPPPWTSEYVVSQ